MWDKTKTFGKKYPGLTGNAQTRRRTKRKSLKKVFLAKNKERLDNSK